MYPRNAPKNITKIIKIPIKLRVLIVESLHSEQSEDPNFAYPLEQVEHKGPSNPFQHSLK